MMAGKLLVPPSDAYGPCFKREAASFRAFELGFDSASLTASPRIVKGLVAGSRAAAAGIRDGDEVTEAVVLDAVQAKPEQTITLKIRRDMVAQALNRNPILVTALNPVIGYEKAAKIAKRAYAENRPVLEVALEDSGLSEKQLRKLLAPAALTKGGIKG